MIDIMGKKYEALQKLIEMFDEVIADKAEEKLGRKGLPQQEEPQPEGMVAMGGEEGAEEHAEHMAEGMPSEGGEEKEMPPWLSKMKKKPLNVMEMGVLAVKSPGKPAPGKMAKKPK